jgi:hypothetical protein
VKTPLMVHIVGGLIRIGWAITSAIIAAALMVGLIDDADARNVAKSDIVNFYVAPNGSDETNTCTDKSSPCLTAQHACDEAVNNWDYLGRSQPYVRLTTGHYDKGCDLAGQPLGAHTLNIVGQQSDDQSCTLEQAEQVVITVQENETAFDFQDLAIGVTRCLTIQGQGGAFRCRQTPASDIAFVKFGHDQPLRGGVAANDSCGINVGRRIWLGNDIHALFNAQILSRITATILNAVAVKPVTITYGALAYYGGIIDAASATYDGDIKSSGGSRVYRNGMILGSRRMPWPCVQAVPAEPGGCW